MRQIDIQIVIQIDRYINSCTIEQIDRQLVRQIVRLIDRYSDSQMDRKTARKKIDRQIYMYKDR